MSQLLVVIVNYKSAQFTFRALDSLLAERAEVPDVQVVVVENDSGDAEVLREGLNAAKYQGWTRLVVAPRNGGFAYGNNVAVRAALTTEQAPEYFLLLNPDTEVQSGALGRLVRFMDEHPKVGIAGANILHEDGKDEGTAFRFPTIWGELERGMRFGPVTRWLESFVVWRRMGAEPCRVDWVFGAAMIVRREVFEQVGLMDEEYFLYYEETDFCLAAQRRGWETWYVPDARVVHFPGQSTGVTVRGERRRRLPDYWFESRRRFFAKNFGLFYAARADLAFGFGATFYGLRTKVDDKALPDPPHLLSDLARHSAMLPTNWRVTPPKTS